ncbi:hypothetical protein DL95DRAFT_510047 [Leptodontidium sp. 2 PMI_412]|nr:hypothetical protein DL95DRAFT_510047 [Leptodontidium sp. 2 PMI_412]
MAQAQRKILPLAPNFSSNSTPSADDDTVIPLVTNLLSMTLQARDSGPAETSSTFTCFPKLPKEPRDKIWRVFAVSPGMFKVLGYLDTSRTDSNARCGRKCRSRTLEFKHVDEEQIIPATFGACLTTCREARKAIMEILPDRLPPTSPHLAIRFDASKTSLLIANKRELFCRFHDMDLGHYRFETVLPRAITNRVLCINSYRGNNVKKENWW